MILRNIQVCISYVVISYMWIVLPEYNVIDFVVSVPPGERKRFESVISLVKRQPTLDRRHHVATHGKLKYWTPPLLVWSRIQSGTAPSLGWHPRAQPRKHCAALGFDVGGLDAGLQAIHPLRPGSRAVMVSPHALSIKDSPTSNKKPLTFGGGPWEL